MLSVTKSDMGQLPWVCMQSVPKSDVCMQSIPKSDMGQFSWACMLLVTKSDVCMQSVPKSDMGQFSWVCMQSVPKSDVCMQSVPVLHGSGLLDLCAVCPKVLYGSVLSVWSQSLTWVSSPGSVCSQSQSLTLVS